MINDTIVQQLKANTKVQVYIFQDKLDKQYVCKIVKGNQTNFINELNILSKVQHPHIIKLLDSKDNQLILEYCKNKDLFNYVNIQAFPETIARYYFKQIINTFEYLHDQNICHRDIKLENIVLDDDFDIKLIDFGFSKQLQDNQKLTDCLGTQGYMAPELYNKQIYDPKPVDIFALGVLLFQIVFAICPFNMAYEYDPLYKYIYNGQINFYWQLMNQYLKINLDKNDLVLLLSSMFCKNPQNRWSINQIQKSNWLNKEIASKQEVQHFMTQLKKQLDNKQI